MSYLLDTDIIILWLNNKYPYLEGKIDQIPDNMIFISSITVAELFFGAYNSSKVQQNIELLENIIPEMNIICFDEECGKIFGKLKSELKKSGQLINDSDLFIASIAIKENLCLVTNNQKHFERISDLKIETWVK